MRDYTFREKNSISFHGKESSVDIDTEMFKQAVRNFDESIIKLEEAAGVLFTTLGMRNLSSFVGELFGAALAKASDGFFIKNPHQDGYPDLLAMTDEGKALLKTLERNMQDKKPFSGFATGGLEIKATCGSVPTPAVLARKKLRKPEIGDQRIDVMNSYDWKAHHRLTNNLVGIVWDFVDGVPAIVGIFFSSSLTQDDWGKIVQPKDGGGRTTSVSIMTRNGTKKMYKGWIAVLNDARYKAFFNKLNASDLIN